MMENKEIGSRNNEATRLLCSNTKINILKIEKKLFIKASNTLKNSLCDKKSASAHPIKRIRMGSISKKREEVLFDQSDQTGSFSRTELVPLTLRANQSRSKNNSVRFFLKITFYVSQHGLFPKNIRIEKP